MHLDSRYDGMISGDEHEAAGGNLVDALRTRESSNEYGFEVNFEFLLQVELSMYLKSVLQTLVEMFEDV